MSGYKTEVQNLTYNAATQCFDAVVVFYELGETLKYPCSLPLPIDAEFAEVTHGLIAQAKSRRATNRASLVARSASQTAPKLAHLANLARQFSDKLGLNDTPHAA